MAKENYKCMDHVQHVLERSGMYIGDTTKKESEEWILENDSDVMRKAVISYSKGLLKIFDEIVSNTQDVYNKYGSEVKNVTVIVDDKTISVFNDGPSIPIEKMEDDPNTYIITAMFGRLLSSSNYTNTDQETIGTFGIGAKATNIFSTYFQVQTYDKNSKQLFEQTWENNMSKVSEPKITQRNLKTSFTLITFKPELWRFETESLQEDILFMFKKRVLDLAAVCNGVNIKFNDTKYVFKTTLDYLKLYTKTNIIYDSEEQYDYGIIFDSKEGDQISFVNGNLTKSGIHINSFLLLLTKVLKEKIEKKKINTNIKIGNLLKQKIILFLNCKVKNAKYNGQTKEELIGGILPEFILSPKTIRSLNKATFVQEIIDEVINKENKEILKKTNKKNDLRSIHKLDEAQMAGTKEASKCTLILTEGDSAKTIAICGLKIIGRKYYGVFPLKGKLLNTRNATAKQISSNAEIKSLMSIIGLDTNKQYKNTSSLRYGRVMLMTDQDQDGSHIKGLIINFIHSYWPSLVKTNFLYEFITPIVKATKDKEVIEFFNLSDFNKWNDKKKKGQYYIKYYKGLGTSTDKEAESYFSNYDKHTIDFVYKPGDDKEIEKAFDKKLVNQRKEWLQEFMNKGNNILSEDAVLYNRTNDNKNISFGDFIDKELIHFSNADNIRSIPSIIDGFKPGQRKVMHVVFGMSFTGKKNEIKVEQLAGYVSANSAYHHGEDSLKLTIINLANDFVGSNNINFLNPIGQYGSRLQGGKDRSSPRYIYTNLLPIARKIFIKDDENVLNYLTEENQKIEPEYFVPIIPTLLVNGARGIGTGWATNIPCFNPIDIIDYILEDKKTFVFNPWYHNFIGQTYKINDSTFIVSGNINIDADSTSVIISELPIGMWTETFKKKMLENDDIDLKELSTKDDAVFLITFKDKHLFQSLWDKTNGFYLYFKIVSKIRTNNLIAFNSKHALREYDNPCSIIEEFKVVRLETYKKRKEFLVQQLKNAILIMSNRYRFINQIIKDEINVFKKPKKMIISILEKEKYDVDPDETDLTENNKFDYLIKMSIESFTKEKMEDLYLKKSEKEKDLKKLKSTTIEEMWKTELIDLKKYYMDNFKNKKRTTYKNNKNTYKFIPFVSNKDDMTSIEENNNFSDWETE
ncbi:putative DNA topoisomerase type II [Yalta virus]|nr:putative DNA topoisomerase type II [Yalta virus]